jgi:DNA-binding transcriptional regulator of glucitol operon
MKVATKSIKKDIKYDETNVPAGYCMSGNFMTDLEAKKMSEFIKSEKSKSAKPILQKTN